MYKKLILSSVLSSFLLATSAYSANLSTLKPNKIGYGKRQVYL